MSKTLHVLIVEDSQDDTVLILRELQHGGFEPKHERVETLKDMEAALSAQHWDLIIADYSMPKFSGADALELYKKHELDIPFIVVSGKIGEETAVEMMKGGAHDYIMKNNLARLNPAVERELREAKHRMERKWTEEKLREMNEYYRALFENIPIGVCFMDTDGNISAHNNAFIQAGDHSNSDMVTIGNIADLFFSCQEWKKILKISRRQDLLLKQQVQLKRKDGTPYEALLTLIQLKINDRPCWQVMVEDLQGHKWA